MFVHRIAPLALLAPLAILIAVAACLSPLSARADALQTRYSISIFGVPLGKADFATELGATTYAVSGTLRSSGLGALVSSTQGTTSSAGSIGGSRVQPNRYALAYSSDGKSWASNVRLRSGRVVDTTVSPPARNTHPEDYVAVTPAQLRSVMDPLSAMMVKSRPDRVCNRTLPVFDGWSRLDLKLAPGGTAAFSADGFSGSAIVCNVRIDPVGGYRTSSSGVQYLRKQVIKIWFAPIGDSGIYAPVHVRIPTKIGPLTLTATTFAKS